MRASSPTWFEKDAGSKAARLTQQRLGASEQHPDGVGQQVARAADDPLARLAAGRIDRSAPIFAAFPVWLSMIAVVGVASGPAFSRTAT